MGPVRHPFQWLHSFWCLPIEAKCQRRDRKMHLWVRVVKPSRVRAWNYRLSPLWYYWIYFGITYQWVIVLIIAIKINTTFRELGRERTRLLLHRAFQKQSGQLVSGMQLCKFSLTSCRWSLILVQPWEGGIVFLLVCAAPQQQRSRWGFARHLFTFLFFKKQMIHIINHTVSIWFSHVFHRTVWSTFDLPLLKCATKAMKWKMIRKWARNPKNRGGEASEWSGVKF